MITAVRPRERHEYLYSGTERDPLLDLEWVILLCPVCGRCVQVCWDPFKKLTLEPGKDDLTAADVEQINALCKAGRTEEAKRIMAREPAHYYTQGPIMDLRIELNMD